MRTLKNSELKTLEQLLRLKQEPLKKVLARFLKKNYSRVLETKDYIVAEGDIPIALVAHMDTVFKAPPSEIFFDTRLNAMISPDGLGADDRAGVFAILQIIQAGFKPHIIFTTDEELGGLGASALALLDCPFKKLHYIIQLDRRGAQDCVFYDCDNHKFADYVESFGFTTAWGTFTDICFLCPQWGVAGVNLSVGYRNEHSQSEVLFIGQLLSTIEKVKQMLSQQDIPFFEYVPTVYYNGLSYGNYDSWRVIKCQHCGRYFIEEEMFSVIMQNGSTSLYCPECLEEVSWCKVCNSPYEKYSLEAPLMGICPKCVNKEGKNG